MAPYDDLLRKLDEKAFLGLRAWDFSFRSLPRRYATAFLQKVVFRHPLRALGGLLSYRRVVKGDSKERDTTHFFPKVKKDFQRRAAEAERTFLVAVSFCQKAIKQSGSHNGCPAGRFNHHCLYAAELDISKPKNIPFVCHGCDIRPIATKALLAGANMHIMTSALDVLHDIFVPSLERARFSSAIFCICPYSVHPIALPLHICGIESFVVQFNSGYCADYSQWSLADTGIKNERTFVSAEGRRTILDFLDGVGEIRAELGMTVYYCFQLEGNIYVPV
jgi:hypothetical protein